MVCTRRTAFTIRLLLFAILIGGIGYLSVITVVRSQDEVFKLSSRATVAFVVALLISLAGAVRVLFAPDLRGFVLFFGVGVVWAFGLLSIFTIGLALILIAMIAVVIGVRFRNPSAMSAIAGMITAFAMLALTLVATSDPIIACKKGGGFDSSRADSVRAVSLSDGRTEGVAVLGDREYVFSCFQGRLQKIAPV